MGVPKLIHQIWFDFSKDGSGANPPNKYVVEQDNCRQVNKDWDFILWNSEACLNLIRTRYPEYLEMYLSYEYPIQQVDAARYFILHAFGGVYMDMDIKCRKPLYFEEDGVYLVKVGAIYKYNNAFIASSRGDPFWNVMFQVLKESSKNNSKSLKNLNVKSLIVFNTTGPFTLDKAVEKYTGNTVKILSTDLYQSCDLCGNISTEDYYIVHHNDGNWGVGNIENLSLSMWCKKEYILVVALVILGISLVFLIKSFQK